MAQLVNTNDFEKEVLECTTPVLVDFYADWCGPCKMMSPVVDPISLFSRKENLYQVSSVQHHPQNLNSGSRRISDGKRQTDKSYRENESYEPHARGSRREDPYNTARY